jgi:hypothetical protein
MARHSERGLGPARLIGGIVAAAVIALSAGAAVSQTKTDDTNATGQSERPANPKQIEPESQSHDAEKPKDKQQSEIDEKDKKKN